MGDNVMRRFLQSYYLMIWIWMGVLVATVVSNRLFASGVIHYQALYEGIIAGWKELSGKNVGILVGVLFFRSLETGLLWWLCRRADSYHKTLGLCLLLFGFGMTIGISVVLFTWCRGWIGLWLWLLASLPHEPCYIGGWSLLILGIKSGYGRGTRFWLTVCFLLAMGIWMEIWINPLLAIFV